MRNLTLLTLTILFGFSTMAAGPTGGAVQGTLLAPGGAPVTNNSVDFKVQVLDKTGTCVMYEEEHLNVDLSLTNGDFSFDLGFGTSRVNNMDGSAALKQNVFRNDVNVAPGAAWCMGGLTFANGDARMLRVQFDVGSGYVAMTPDMRVNGSVYSVVAETLQGKSPAEFLQAKDDATYDLNQTNVENVFSVVNFAKLMDLINGTSNQYMDSVPTAAVSFNNQAITNVANPTNAQDAATKNYSDTRVTGYQVDLGNVAPGTGGGKVLVWDQAQSKWVATALSTSDNTKLPLDGSGTMTGALQMGAQNITNIGHMTMAAQRTIHVGTYTDAQETTLIASPLAAIDEGKIWYNSDKNTLRAWDGAAANSVLLSGGNSNGATIVAGTNDNQSLQLETNNTARMTILNSGAVGIATATPSAGLQIATNAAASAPAALVSGTWFTGGTSTTTKPMLLIEPTGATSNTWNTAGIGIGVNAPSGFSGHLAQFQINGSNRYRFNSNDLLLDAGGAGHFVTSTGAPLIIRGSSGDYSVKASQIAHTGLTSGEAGSLQVGDTGWGFTPTSGTATYNILKINTLINQTGTATGVSRGIYVNPTLTSSADFRGIETAAYNQNLVGTPPATIKQVAFNAPTLVATGATTVTNAATQIISGAPVAGANVTITNPYSFWVQGGNARFDGNVGIGTTTPTTGSRLDIAGTTAADSTIIVPRADTANRPAVGVNGMTRYNTSLNKFEFYENGAWTSYSTGSGAAGDFMKDGSVAMTGNFRAGSQWISNDGDSEGIRIANDGKVGIGTASPQTPLAISANATIQTPNSGSVFQMTGADNSSVAMTMDAFGNNFWEGPYLTMRRAHGTSAAPALPAVNDFLGVHQFLGWTAANTYNETASISVSANENWTGAARGTRMELGATRNGTTAITTYMRLANDGVGFMGIATPASTVHINGTKSQTSWTTRGSLLAVDAGTLTDTTGSGTIATRTANSFGAPVYASSSATVLTDASTLYIAGAPTAGANTTITNSHALHVAAGNSYFGGNVGIGVAVPTTGAMLDITGTTAATSSIIIPRADTANRPAVGVNGMMRYNTTDNRFEFYQNGGWTNYATGTGGAGDFMKDGSVAMTGNFRAGSQWISNDGDSEGIRIANDGKVGIGTASPTEALTVNGSVIVGTNNNFAAGANSMAMGTNNSVAGDGSIGVGNGNIMTATGDVSAAFGNGNSVSGVASVALGQTNSVTGNSSIAMGQEARAHANNTMAIGLGNATATPPTVSAVNSMGIFMGDQSGVDVTTSNVMAIMGGKVGIGNVAPAEALDIGTAASPQNIKLTHASGSGGITLTDPSTNSMTIRRGYIGTGPSLTVGTTGTNPLLLMAGNSTRVQIDNNGIIAMGTTTPTAGARLDVVGTTAADSSILIPRADTATRPTTGVDGMIRYNTSLAKFEAHQNGGWVNMIGTGTGDFLRDGSLAMTGNFRAGSQWISNDGDNEGIRIDNSGYVGVGTASPSTSFHVVSSESTWGGTIFENTSNAASSTFSTILNMRRTNTVGNGVGTGLNMYDASNAIAEYGYFGAIIESNSTGNQSGSIAFFPRKNNVRTEALRITSAGNVGIGTTNPAGGLEVAKAAALSAPPLLVSGTWVSGGTATTTKPQVLIEPAGATSTGWHTGGTGLGVNAPSGFGGFLMDLQINGSRRLGITGNDIQMYSGASWLTATAGPWNIRGSNASGYDIQFFQQGNTTATGAGVDAGHVGSTGNFITASGTATYANYKSYEVINQTGTATGVSRGAWYSPTLTSAYDYRAIEVAGYTQNLVGTPPTTLQQVLFNAPTLAAGSAKTVTNAATQVITGAPIAGSNVTITNPYSFWVQGGNSRFDGNVGIGTTSPGNLLTVSGNGEAAVEIQAFDNNAVLNPLFVGKRARGTQGSPANVVSGDTVFEWAGFGYAAGAYRAAAYIGINVDGTPGAGDMPGRIDFATSPDGTEGPLTRMTVKNDGKVGIGTTAPAEALEVQGKIAVRLDATAHRAINIGLISSAAGTSCDTSCGTSYCLGGYVDDGTKTKAACSSTASNRNCICVGQ